MAIPWIVGAIGLYAAKKVYDVIKDDNTSSPSSYDSEDKERRKKETAEEERKKSERRKNQKDAIADFFKQGRKFGEILSGFLPNDLVSATSLNSYELAFDIKKTGKKINIEEAIQRDSGLMKVVDELKIIFPKENQYNKIIENIVIFFELYKPSFKGEKLLLEQSKKVLLLDEEIENINKIKEGLKKFLEKEGL